MTRNIPTFTIMEKHLKKQIEALVEALNLTRLGYVLCFLDENKDADIYWRGSVADLSMVVDNIAEVVDRLDQELESRLTIDIPEQGVQVYIGDIDFEGGKLDIEEDEV